MRDGLEEADRMPRSEIEPNIVYRDSHLPEIRRRIPRVLSRQKHVRLNTLGVEHSYCLPCPSRTEVGF